MTLEVQSLQKPLNLLSMFSPSCTETPAFTVTGIAKDGDENGTVILTLVTTNTGNDYNSSTGEFTCRIPGLYNFFISIEKQLDVSQAFCHLMLNNNSTMLIAARTAFTDAGSYIQASNSAVLQLDFGDIVRLGDCSKAETFTEHSTFSGYLIHE